MYQLHPCTELVQLFRDKPYQGTKPEDAEFVFVGLDANFDKNICKQPEYDLVKAYLTDGPAFWREHNTHHPFLVGGYSGEGLPYHLYFEKLGFGPQDADRVSFIELMDIPTVNIDEKLEAKDLNPKHMDRLESLMEGKGARPHVFLCDEAIGLLEKFRKRMRDAGRLGRPPFEWLPKPIPNEVLPKLRESKTSTIYQYLHFSYRYFPKRMEAQAKAIAALRERCAAIRVTGDPKGAAEEVL